jgi:hypothetical protein
MTDIGPLLPWPTFDRHGSYRGTSCRFPDGGSIDAPAQDQGIAEYFTAPAAYITLGGGVLDSIGTEAHKFGSDRAISNIVDPTILTWLCENVPW